MAEEERPAWLDEILAPQPEAEPFYPGIDPDGKERLPLFAGRFAAKDTAMQGVTRPIEDYDDTKPQPGAVALSPFV